MKNIRISFKEVVVLAELNNMKLIKSEFLGNRTKSYYVYTLYQNDTKIFESELLKNIKNFINSLEETEIVKETINTLDFGKINIFSSVEEYETKTVEDDIDLIKNEVHTSSESGLIELSDGLYVQPYITFKGEIIGVMITD